MARETLQLAQPKIEPLGAAERAEAARLLAALIRAALASGAPRGTLHPNKESSSPRRGRATRPRSRKVAGTLPMAHTIDGKPHADEPAGQVPR
jgi:hypothetical protein